MRVLHIEKMPFANSGVTSYIRALTRLQTRCGHEVFLFGCVKNTDPSLPLYHDFQAVQRPTAVWGMIHNSEAANKLESFLRHRPVDVAHLHNLYHHLTPSILPVLARRRIGMVMTMHDYRLACPAKHFLDRRGTCTRCLPNRFHHAVRPGCSGLAGAALALESYYHRFWRSYFHWVDFFVCPTEFMRSVLLAIGAPAGKCVVVPNPVEPPALPSDARQSPRQLLFIGRLTGEKAPELMLDLAQRLPDAQVTIVGDGALRESLLADARRRQLGNVVLPGQVDHENLGAYYASATAVVIASRCFENSPQVLLEAMSARRCVIAPDHGPMRQWVSDGRTGRLFAPGSAESLAAVAREVLADSAARERMAAAGAELIAVRHNPQAVADRLDDLYKEANHRCTLRW
jgi:glycosyltransferase involved in cell wall biosynthesis